MRKLGRLALVAAVVAMATSSALAQERQRQRQRPGGGAGFGGGTTFLLQQESVQKELKLSEDQVKKIKELSEKQRESFRGLRDLSQEERRTKIQEAVKANEKAVGEILKPAQLKRIKQISLQQQGARALGNPEIAKTLKLTSEQTDKIKKIQEEARAARGERGQRGRLDEEARKKLEEARKATNEKIMNVLTAEQKSKLKELTGEPFKGEIRRPQFGGNRPGGEARRPARRG